MASSGSIPLDLTMFDRHGWLSRQPASFRQRLLAASRPLAFSRHSEVYGCESEPGGIYGIVSGAVGVEVASNYLSPRLAHIHRVGVWFGHGPILDGTRRTMGFRAMEDTTLLHVELAKLREMIRNDPLVALSMGALANDASVIAGRAVCELMIPDVQRRIAAILLRATGADEWPQREIPDNIFVNQSDLADMANASRHSVLRALAKFERSGWIERGYTQLHVTDLAALQAFAYSED